jgi:hypothetical protein
MQASGSGPSGPEEFERELRRVLYRFDCPDAHELGEYQLDLLDEGRRTQIASHSLDCDECRNELYTLREFLAMPDVLPEPPVARVRRFVATLFVRTSPMQAYGGLRGTNNGSTRVFEAHDVTITVGRGQSGDALLGLVVVADQPPDVLNGHAARLISRQGETLVTRLDDLGNFEFAHVSGGAYVLEIDLSDGVLVVEELVVD